MITFKELEVRFEGLKSDTLLLNKKIDLLDSQIGLYKKSQIEYDSVIIPSLNEKVKINFQIYQNEKKAGKKRTLKWVGYSLLSGVILGGLFL